ncbi:MAG: thiamine pyrophosphate-dependent dehydrogenase E1 component subunit alpha [Nitrososphaerales archaeon]
MQRVVQVIKADGATDERLNLGLSAADILRLYRTMVLTRTLDTKMTSLQRQGRIGFYLSSFGEEACSVGSALAMSEQDWFFPAYREQGAALLRGVPLRSIIAHLLGSAEDEFKGRSLPGIFGNKSARFVIPSAPVASQIPHAVGASLAAQILGHESIAIVYFGDGATSANDFHCGMNFAGVYHTPTILFCKNNQYAISTPTKRQTASDGIAVKARAYGFDGVMVDGNDVLAVYLATRRAVEKARSGGGPTLIESLTYRLSAHSTSDDPRRYRSDSEYREWIKRDPIAILKLHMDRIGIWNKEYEEETQADAERQVTKAIRLAESAPRPDPITLITDVYSEPTLALREQYESL